MECRLKCENPGKIEYTLTITMRAEDWEVLRDQLDKIATVVPWPTSTLRMNIDDLLSQARKIFWPMVEAPAQNAEERGTP